MVLGHNNKTKKGCIQFSVQFSSVIRTKHCAQSPRGGGCCVSVCAVQILRRGKEGREWEENAVE